MAKLHNYRDTHRKMAKKLALLIPAMVALPLLSPPLKFQKKMAYSWGK
jgi:hypothetical protein